ncbi:MAG: hypothetical protein JWM80_7 [Cyanobacteria bacterium RYN_339]|nr:hypothetical protein [Cyanobacteria bacterium RYN_339]
MPLTPHVRLGGYACLLALAAAGCAPRGGAEVAPNAHFVVGAYQVDPILELPRSTDSPPTPAPSDGASTIVTPGTPPTPAPASGGSNGGGSSSSGARPPVFTGTVLTQAELPIEGATVRLPDGLTAQTDDQGKFSVEGTHPYSPLVVSHPAFATSVVTGLDAFVPLHLGPRTGQGDLFNKLVGDVVGDAQWPLADLGPGAVFYQDTRRNSSQPGDLQADGSYRIRFTLDHPGAPRASLIILAANAAGTLLVGLTPPFTPLAEEPPAHVPMVLADRPLAYSATGLPLGMTATGAALQVVQADGLVVAVVAAPGASGTFMVPAPGSLPGTLRVAIEARDDDQARTSVVYLDGGAAAPTAAFLAPPVVIVDQTQREAHWAPVPEAVAYRVQVRRLDGGTLYEAWTDVPRVEVPAADWPAAGNGEMIVEAVAGSLTARQVASVAGPRQLRLEPLAGLPTGRVATTHVKLL